MLALPTDWPSSGSSSCSARPSWASRWSPSGRCPSRRSTPSTSRSATGCSRSSCSASRCCRPPPGFQDAVDDGGLTGGLLAVGLGGLLIAFAAWWLYFDHPGHLAPTPRVAFRWGYGHVVVFASLAAIGAGLHLAAVAHGSRRRHRRPHRRARRRPGRRRLPRSGWRCCCASPAPASAARGSGPSWPGRPRPRRSGGGERSGHGRRLRARARRARRGDGRHPRASRTGRIGAPFLGVSRRALTARRRRRRRSTSRRSPVARSLTSTTAVGQALGRRRRSSGCRSARRP